MKVLVIGSGGREHALVWKINQSPLVEKVFAVPGNGGIATLAECHPELQNNEAIVAFIKEQKIDLTVVGPEAPLVAGLANLLHQHNLPVFGPVKEAALIEGSKIFAKRLMLENNIPTGQAAFFNDYKEAAAYLQKQEPPYVVKADGLAAGKGVTVAENLDEALQALADCLLRKKFGTAGENVLIEEFLSGQEVSVLAFVDGKAVVPMVAAQDYKRLKDGNAGPNTGGMGAYAPAIWAQPDFYQEVVEKVLQPTVNALTKKGIRYQGVLYAGLILTDQGLKVLEFNARFGDPETQVILPLLETDLVEVMLACLDGKLKKQRVQWSQKKAVTVVLASAGYPEQPWVGEKIVGLGKQLKNGYIFHAGTKLDGNEFVTNGGRVLNVTGWGRSYKEARETAYEHIKEVYFKGCQYRRDIALVGGKNE